MKIVFAAGSVALLVLEIILPVHAQNMEALIRRAVQNTIHLPADGTPRTIAWDDTRSYGCFSTTPNGGTRLEVYESNPAEYMRHHAEIANVRCHNGTLEVKYLGK